MREVRQLRRQDEELCQRLAMDPFYVSSTTVPTTNQMEALKVSRLIAYRGLRKVGRRGGGKVGQGE